MSTYTTSTVRLNTQRSAQLAKQLRIALDNSTLVKAARADLTVTAEDLAALENTISTWDAPLTAALSTLSPEHDTRARVAIDRANAASRRQAGTSRAEIAARIAEAKSHLARALEDAQRRIDSAIAESATQVVLACGRELGYRVTPRRCGETTAIDLRRDDEVTLMVVRGDTIVADHAGLADGSCVRQQRELLEAMRARGVELVETGHDNHYDAAGGQLIRAAVGENPRRLNDPGAFAQSAADHTEHQQSRTPHIHDYGVEENLDGPRIQA